MKACVLQPDYSQSTVKEDYKNCKLPRNLSHLLPEDQVDHVFLKKAITYRQLRELKNQSYNILSKLNSQIFFETVDFTQLTQKNLIGLKSSITY